MAESPLLVDGELILYGTVGFTFFEEGFTAKQVLDALAEHGRSKPLTIRINSGGGFLDDGKAIYNAIRAHRGKTTAYVDSVAASAASLILMAADERIMRPGALLMVHKPETITIGDDDEHRKALDMLAAEIAVMVDIYAEATDRPSDDIEEEVTAETWMTPDEALDKGYCDKVEKGSKAVAAAAFPYHEIYEHPPKQLLALASRNGWTRAKMERKRMATKPTGQADPADPNQPDPALTPPAPGTAPLAPRQPTVINAGLDPALIAERCTAANLSILSGQLIREGADEARVTARIEEAKQIVQRVEAARKQTGGLIDPSIANQFIATGASIDHVKAELFDRIEAASRAQPATNTQANLGRMGDGTTGNRNAPADPMARATPEEQAILDRAAATVNARRRSSMRFQGNQGDLA